MNPFLYRLRPEIGTSARMAVVDKYVLVFRVLENVNSQSVLIERVVNGARDLPILID
jgi:plasmid stabilization system protein ParE